MRLRYIIVGICILTLLLIIVIKWIGNGQGQSEKTLSPRQITFLEDNVKNNPDLVLASHVSELKSLSGDELSEYELEIIWQFVDQLNFVKTFQAEPKDGGVRASIVIPVEEKTYTIQLCSPSNIVIYWGSSDGESQRQSKATGNRYTTEETIFYNILTIVDLYYPADWSYKE